MKLLFYYISRLAGIYAIARLIITAYYAEKIPEHIKVELSKEIVAMLVVSLVFHILWESKNNE